MTDFRALCIELTDCLEKADWPLRYRYVFRQWVDIARAALADGPAVLDGREPASVTGQPSDEELLETLDKATATFPPRHPEAEGLNAVEYPLALELRKARAVLARWGTSNLAETRSSLGGMPTPVPADKGEVAELVRWLRSRAGIPASPDFPAVAAMLTRAADLLEQRHPVPVPVSERLPQAEDCDEKGSCWLWSPDDVDGVGHWSYSHRDWAQEGDVTHWLPATALPVPQGEVE